MSFDIYLKKDGVVCQAPEVHRIAGGRLAVGGTRDLWLNVTYNYGGHFSRLLGEKGIREIYGKTAAEAIPLLEEAADKLADGADPDYWKPTEGNAKAALLGLVSLAKMAPPDAVFEGD